MSNTSITLKGEDGSDIKLAVLKKPISIDNLEYEHVVADNTYNVDFDVISVKSNEEKVEEVRYLLEDKLPLTFLKVPISLDEIGNGKVLSIMNTESVNKPYVETRSSRRKCSSRENQTWKQNALTLFEFSYVYPFIHAGNKFKCYVCSKPFVESNVLREHTLQHSSQELKIEMNKKVRDKILKVDVFQLQCRLCHGNCPNLISLKLHLLRHGKRIDPNYQDNIIPFKLGGDSFDCQICGEGFQRLRLLVIHMSKHFNNYSCEICGGVFISMSLLKRHLQTHKVGSYPCDKCGKVFANSAKRISHIRGVHLKQCTRTCPHCSERFSSNYQRSKHLRVYHNQTNRYRCEICDRQYDLKYQLFLHKRSVHLQERNQECSVCNSRFFSKYCLARHMVIHTGDKNFKCGVCGKAYTRKKGLQEHFKSHEAVRTSCTVCGNSFIDSTTLTTHMRTIHCVI